MVLRGGATLYTVLRSAVGALLCAFLGSLVDAAICSTARREQLPESLRPRLVATLGSPKTLQQQECEALRTLGRSALDAGLGKKFRREDS